MSANTAQSFLGLSTAQASESMDAEAESAIAVSQYHANTDADEVDLALMETLLMYVCGEGVYKREGEDPDASQGAVLVFLPGKLWVLASLTEACEHLLSPLSLGCFGLLFSAPTTWCEPG